MPAKWFAMLAMLLTPTAAYAQVEPFPSSFQTKTIAANGTQIYVRVGGRGPTVILIHGFGDTGDMWVALAQELVRDHTVVVTVARQFGWGAYRLIEECSPARNRCLIRNVPVASCWSAQSDEPQHSLVPTVVRAPSRAAAVKDGPRCGPPEG